MTTTDFNAPAREERIQRTAEALRANNIEALVVDDAEAAKRAVLERIPDGAEVHSGASETLQETGIQAELEASPRIMWLRKQLLSMDRQTQGRGIRELGAAPDIMLGSVGAVTEDGTLVTASNSGSQLGPYVSGAGRLILVIGAQRVVTDLDEAMRRIYEITNRDPRPGRTTAILVREALGC